MTHPQKHTDYLPGLEGLRAFAVLAVILFHLDIPGLFSSGFLGVDIFFTVSGFLITGQFGNIRPAARSRSAFFT